MAMLCGCGNREYAVRGLVREIRAADSEIVVRHEEIPGFMQAMTMPFRVSDTVALTHLHAGDYVQFRLSVGKTESRADRFVVLTNAAPSAPAPVLNDPNGVSFYQDVPELKPGDRLPAYTLTNQLNQRFKTDDFKGRVLVLNFIFTRCPLPDFCPRESANLSSAIRQMTADASMPTNWHVLTVSFEPEHDTPRVLEAYGRRYDSDPRRWTFATGAHEQIQPLGSHFGLYFSRNVTPDNMNHNLRTVVLRPDGTVAEIIVGNRWTAGQLVESVRKAF